MKVGAAASRVGCLLQVGAPGGRSCSLSRMVHPRRSCSEPKARVSGCGGRRIPLWRVLLSLAGTHLSLLLVAATCAPFGMAELPVQGRLAAFYPVAGPLGYKTCTGFPPIGNDAGKRQRGGLLLLPRATMLGGMSVDGPMRRQASAGLPSSSPVSLLQAGSRIGVGGLTAANLSGKSGGGGDPVKTQQLRTRLKSLKVAELRALLKQFGTSEDPKLKK